MAHLPKKQPIPAQIERIMRVVEEMSGDIPGAVAAYARFRVDHEKEMPDLIEENNFRLHIPYSVRRLIVLQWEIDVTKTDMALPLVPGELDNAQLPDELEKLTMAAEFAAEQYINPVETVITYELRHVVDWLNYYDGTKRIINAEMAMDITPHIIETRLGLTDGGQNEIVFHRTKPENK